MHLFRPNLIAAVATTAGILLSIFLHSADGMDSVTSEPYECTITLQDGVVARPIIQSTVVTLCLNITAKHDAATHVVVQAHVHRGNIMISMDKELHDGRFINGSNVGLVSSMNEGDLMRWFLVSYVSGNDDRRVSIMATVYEASEPVPGGCNLEFPLKNDPNVYIRRLGSNINVIGFGYGDSDPGSKCGASKSQQSVRYDIYQFFMSERDLSAINYHAVLEDLMDSDYVRGNGLFVTSRAWNDVTEVTFPAYRGIGTVFVVIMTVTHGNTMTEASYVPSVTYSCDELEDVCFGEDKLVSKVLTTVLAVFGLCICFCGHRFFKTEMFFFGLLAAMLAAFILLERFSGWTFSTYLYTSIGVGVVGGVIWLSVWVFFGLPQMSVVLVALLLGYMLLSVIFNMSSLGVMFWLHVGAYFHSVFFSAALGPVIISLFATRQVNVLSCAIVGSFFVVLAADICLHGAVKYVLLNTIWRSSTPLFVEAFCLLPVQLSDIILYFVWAVIAISGIIVQYFLEKKKRPFPECPWTVYRRSGYEVLLPSEPESYGNGDDDDEHRPLLIATRRRDSQAASRTWREQPVEQLGQPEENSAEWWQLPQDSATPSAVPVVSNTNTPPPPYEESEPLGRAV